MQAVVKSQAISSSELFLKFIRLKPDYGELDAELSEKAQHIVAIPASDWKATANKDGVAIHTTGQAGSKLLICRTQTVIKASMARVTGVYNTKDLWKRWLPDLLAIKVIEPVWAGPDGAYKEMMYCAYKVPVISNRDTSTYSHYFKGTPQSPGAEGSFTLLTCSTQHPAIPNVRGFVRGELGISATVFTAVQGGIKLTSFLHMDPKAPIPASLLNMMMGTATASVAKMREFIESDTSIPGGAGGDTAGAAAPAPAPRSGARALR